MWVRSLGQEDPLEEGMSLQYSCLENPTHRGAWQVTVHEIARVGHDLVFSLTFRVFICSLSHPLTYFQPPPAWTHVSENLPFWSSTLACTLDHVSTCLQDFLLQVLQRPATQTRHVRNGSPPLPPRPPAPTACPHLCGQHHRLPPQSSWTPPVLLLSVVC